MCEGSSTCEILISRGPAHSWPSIGRRLRRRGWRGRQRGEEPMESQEFTEEEWKAMLREARAEGRRAERVEPRATRAWYDAEAGRVMFELKNGCVFGFPQEFGEGIEHASPDQLAAVDPAFWGGEALHWEELD